MNTLDWFVPGASLLLVLAAAILYLRKGKEETSSVQTQKEEMKHLPLASTKPEPEPEPPPYGSDAAEVDRDIAELAGNWRAQMSRAFQRDLPDLELALLAREYLFALAMNIANATASELLGWWASQDFAEMLKEHSKKEAQAINLAKQAHQLKLAGATRESFIEYGQAIGVLSFRCNDLSRLISWLNCGEKITPLWG